MFIDAKKTRSPKKRKAATKTSTLRESSPSPSSSPVKVTQRRGRKGRDHESGAATTEAFAVELSRVESEFLHVRYVCHCRYATGPEPGTGSRISVNLLNNGSWKHVKFGGGGSLCTRTLFYQVNLPYRAVLLLHFESDEIPNSRLPNSTLGRSQQYAIRVQNHTPEYCKTSSRRFVW